MSTGRWNDGAVRADHRYAVGVGKVIDREFVRDLGKKIESSSDESVPGAKQAAVQAQETMQTAGQGGGLAVAAAFYFASSYVELTWETKHEEAATLNDAAQRIAKNWDEVEINHTIPGVI